MFKSFSMKKHVIMALAVSMFFGILIAAALVFTDSTTIPEGVAPSEDVFITIEDSPYLKMSAVPLADGSIQLSATMNPSNTTNKKVDWSVSFVNGSSTWASGKRATDYVSVTPTSDGALTATVSNLQPFGAQIKVTVTSRVDPSVSASCICDYQKRYTAMNASFGSNAYTLTNSSVTSVPAINADNDSGSYELYNTPLDFKPVLGVGSVEPDIISSSFAIKISDEMYNELEELTVGSIENTFTISVDENLQSEETLAMYISRFITEFAFGQNGYWVGTTTNLFNTCLQNCSSSAYDFEITYNIQTTMQTFTGSVKLKFDRGQINFFPASINLNSSTVLF